VDAIRLELLLALSIRAPSLRLHTEHQILPSRSTDTRVLEEADWPVSPPPAASPVPTLPIRSTSRFENRFPVADALSSPGHFARPGLNFRQP
jgi:hypothetical protein